MFLDTYNLKAFELTQTNRSNTERISKSLLKKGFDGKLTKEEKDFLVKIDNHINRSHYNGNVTKEQLLEYCSKISEGGIYEVLSQQFIKDVTKQNLSEKAQLQTMKDNGFPMNTISGSDKKSLRFDKFFKIYNIITIYLKIILRTYNLFIS
jgi:hypothetical protein